MTDTHSSTATMQLLGEYLHGQPSWTGEFKAQPEDFKVVEQLTLPESDPELQQGEHQWLWVEKKGANTAYVAGQLARFAEVKERDVSFAGLKDRHAVTQQWFSVQLPGKALLNWHELEHPEFKVLSATLQPRKLKTGTHKANQFTLRIRDISDASAFEQRWQLVCEHGVPNYFGLQRFGHDGQNLEQARQWFSNQLKRRLNRNQKSLYLSAVRSFLFNQVLSARIAAQQLTPLPGDAMLLSGSQSYFLAETADTELLQRFESGDIQLSGPLPGGSVIPQAAAAELEQQVLAAYPELLAGLQQHRLEAGRRALLLRLEQPELEWLDATTAQLSFVLPKGSFATSVLRELMIGE